jgi:hypothetical protein
MEFQVEKIIVSPRSRKLSGIRRRGKGGSIRRGKKAIVYKSFPVWWCGVAQDIVCEHSIEIENEITKLLMVEINSFSETHLQSSCY